MNVVVVVVLKVGVQGSESEWLKLFSSLSNEKDEECSCGVVAVDFGGKRIYFLCSSQNIEPAFMWSSMFIG